jgi:hypothetical protein
LGEKCASGKCAARGISRRGRAGGGAARRRELGRGGVSYFRSGPPRKRALHVGPGSNFSTAMSVFQDSGFSPHPRHPADGRRPLSSLFHRWLDSWSGRDVTRGGRWFGSPWRPAGSGRSASPTDHIELLMSGSRSKSVRSTFLRQQPACRCS